MWSRTFSTYCIDHNVQLSRQVANDHSCSMCDSGLLKHSLNLRVVARSRRNRCLLYYYDALTPVSSASLSLNFASPSLFLRSHKKLFVCIIKEFVCCELCLLLHILYYNVHKLSKYKKQFVYIIKEFVFCVLSPNTHTSLKCTQTLKVQKAVCVHYKGVCVLYRVSYHTYSYYNVHTLKLQKAVCVHYKGVCVLRSVSLTSHTPL